MHAIKSIAPVLGVVAFVGLSVLAFLLFQQARDIRRLREWAGRAPERAQEAAEAVQAAAEASRDEAGAASPAGAEGLAEEGEPPGRVGAAWARLRGAVGSRLVAIDRRLPVDGRYLLGIVAALVIAAAVVTSGFGLVGGDSGGKDHKHGASDKPKVAVLNGTSVSNLASRVDHDVVKKAGYKSSEVTNSPSSFTQTVVMYESGRRADAKALATAIQPKLGQTPTGQMTADVQARAGGAPLALALGLDDATFGGG